MGNCMNITDKPTAECHICNYELKHRYIYCLYCKKRYHYHCLGKIVPNLDSCCFCNTNNLQFIDNKEIHRTEESVKYTSINNKRFTI